MALPKSGYHSFGSLSMVLLALLQVVGIYMCKASQVAVSDSLLKVYTSTTEDTLKAESLVQLIVYLDSTNQLTEPKYAQFRNMNNLETWIKSGQQANRISFKLDAMGVKNRNNGQYLIAINLHETALALAKKADNLQKQSIILNNIGVVHRRLDNYEKASDFHMQALKLAESENDSITMAIAINSLGNIQVAIGNLDEASKLFTKSMEIEKQLNNKLGIAINLNNMGNIFQEKGDFIKAKKYYTLSLEVNRLLDNKKGIAICYNDLGNLLQKEGDYDQALAYLQSAFAINQKLKDKNYLAYSYIKLGELYTVTHHNKLALSYLNAGLELSKKINAKNNLVEAYTSLYNIEYNKGRYKKALDYLQLAHQYHDSILNINIRKEIARLQISFESERQALQINSLKQQAAISQLEIKRQKTIRVLFMSAFILAIILVAFLSFYLFSKSKTNRLLMEKNKIIEKAGVELDNYARQLLSAKKEAEKNSRTKSEFLANMSHEIRTPLNSVIGFSELLRQSITNPKHLTYLKLISGSGKSLLMLINDILDLSKIEEEKLEIHYAPVDLTMIIHEIEQIFSPNIIEKGLQFRSHISPSFPKQILFSDIRFRQILFNLVGNAIKFTDKGLVELIIDYDYDEEKQRIELIAYVKDTGKGITTANQESVFEAFNQTDIMHVHQGSGLGLTITRRLVKMMNGYISIESYPDTGSILSIYFGDVLVINDSNESTSAHHTETDIHIQLLLYQPKNTEPDFYFNSLPDVQHVKKQLTNTFEEVNLTAATSELVIICGDNKNGTQKVLEIISKTRQDRPTQVIVIGEQPIEPTQENIQVTLFPTDISPSAFNLAIAQILRQITHPIDDHNYFTNNELYLNNQRFITLNKHLISHHFLPAVNTKLINHIREFYQAFSLMADEFNDAGIKDYCYKLEARTDEFDTVGIDQLLKIYDNQFIIRNTTNP